MMISCESILHKRKEIDINILQNEKRDRKKKKKKKVYSQEGQRVSSMKWNVVREKCSPSSQGSLYAYV
jgi:hypothetical protein